MNMKGAVCLILYIFTAFLCGYSCARDSDTMIDQALLSIRVEIDEMILHTNSYKQTGG